MKFGTKKIAAGNYRVTVDDRDTDLRIVKGDPPKFGLRQEWWVYRGSYDWPIFSTKGKAECVDAVAAVYAEIERLDRKDARNPIPINAASEALTKF